MLRGNVYAAVNTTSWTDENGSDSGVVDADVDVEVAGRRSSRRTSYRYAPRFHAIVDTCGLYTSDEHAG